MSFGKYQNIFVFFLRILRTNRRFTNKQNRKFFSVLEIIKNDIL